MKKGCNRRKKDTERKKTRVRAKFTLTLFDCSHPPPAMPMNREVEEKREREAEMQT